MYTAHCCADLYITYVRLAVLSVIGIVILVIFVVSYWINRLRSLKYVRERYEPISRAERARRLQVLRSRMRIGYIIMLPFSVLGGMLLSGYAFLLAQLDHWPIVVFISAASLLISGTVLVGVGTVAITDYIERETILRRPLRE